MNSLLRQVSKDMLETYIPNPKHDTIDIEIDMGVMGEQKVTVSYNFYQGYSGRTRGDPANCYPALPDDLDLHSVVWKGFDITKECDLELVFDELKRELKRKGLI